MIPVLSEQQRQALHASNDTGPIVIVDSTTNTSYVLVRADVFDELRGTRGDLEPELLYPLIDQVMADDDAADPWLASYQDDALLREP